MANYHPADELLMQFAAGQLTNALGIQTACHLESCRECHKKVFIYEQLGGDLIDISTPVDVDAEAKSRLLKTLHEKRASGELRTSDDASVEILDPVFQQQLEQV